MKGAWCLTNTLISRRVQPIPGRCRVVSRPVKRIPRRWSGLALILAGCAHELPRNEATMNAPNPEWTSINIADGSANAYRFTRDASGRVAFVYVPVRPEQSSTGMYSGGPPRKEDLAANDPRLIELWALLKKLEADETRHQPDRNKGTGAIRWENPSGKHDFIIQMGAALNELMAVLARFG